MRLSSDAVPDQTIDEKVMERAVDVTVCSNADCPKRFEGLNPLTPADSSRNLKSCGGCGMVQYCSSKCQKQDWKRHRPICKRYGSRPVATPKSDDRPCQGP